MAQQEEKTEPVEFEPLLKAILAVTSAMGKPPETLRAMVKELDEIKNRYMPVCRRAHVVKDPDPR
jgi:hypothetical protein